jgi:hypothetical protein
MDYQQDLMREAMFSHASTSKWKRFDSGTGPGYAERVGEAKRYGYTACANRFKNVYNVNFTSDEGWNFLTGMIDAHQPFAASIRLPEGGHIVCVNGYSVYYGCPDARKFVHIADPGRQDLKWIKTNLIRWELKSKEGVDDPRSFITEWVKSTKCCAVVASPMPVSLKFEPFAEEEGGTASFRITATVRTCLKYPISSPTNKDWERVNCLLSRHTLQGTEDGMGEGLPIKISYPSTIERLSGNETQYFTPTNWVDETIKTWEFRRDGQEKGAEIKVLATAWAVQMDANLSECQSHIRDDISDSALTLPMSGYQTNPDPGEGYDPGGTLLHPEFPFLVILGDEIMSVIGIDENDNTSFMVVRAQRNTQASAHPAGTAVKLFLMDELYGWAVLRIDKKLVRVKNAQGATIAAFGDQGNVYLAGSVHEWQPESVLLPQSGVEEFLLRSQLLDEVIGKITPSGDLYLLGGYQDAMDDVNDSCDVTNNVAASEQYYLDHPSSAAFLVKSVSGGESHVVANIDSNGVTVSSEGEGEGEGESQDDYICGEGEGEGEQLLAPPLYQVGGNMRIKGHIFQNWTAWSYWD